MRQSMNRRDFLKILGATPLLRFLPEPKTKAGKKRAGWPAGTLLGVAPKTGRITPFDSDKDDNLLYGVFTGERIVRHGRVCARVEMKEYYAS